MSQRTGIGQLGLTRQEYVTNTQWKLLVEICEDAAKPWPALYTIYDPKIRARLEDFGLVEKTVWIWIQQSEREWILRENTEETIALKGSKTRVPIYRPTEKGLKVYELQRGLRGAIKCQCGSTQ